MQVLLALIASQSAISYKTGVHGSLKLAKVKQGSTSYNLLIIRGVVGGTRGNGVPTLILSAGTHSHTFFMSSFI